MSRTVTIGMPVKDNADTVLDAVRSVFAQTHEDWRLIIVDDGSTDGGPDLVREVDDPRVTVLVDHVNRGLAARLNQIAALTETDILVRMDSDDLMHSTRVARSVGALLAADADLLAGAAVSVDSRSRPGGIRRSVGEATAREALRFSPFIHPTVVGRTAWFRDHPYDESLRRCQDQELWVRTMGSRRTVVLDEVVLYLREGGTVPAAKYARSMAGTRAVVRQHGPSTVGVVGTATLTALTVLKEVTYALADRVGAVDALVARRAEALPEVDLRRHEAEIEGILSVRLPGVD